MNSYFSSAHTPGTRIFRGSPASGVLQAAREWLEKPRSKVALVSLGTDPLTAVRVNVTKGNRMFRLPCVGPLRRLP